MDRQIAWEQWDQRNGSHGGRHQFGLAELAKVQARLSSIPHPLVVIQKITDPSDRHSRHISPGISWYQLRRKQKNKKTNYSNGIIAPRGQIQNCAPPSPYLTPILEHSVDMKKKSHTATYRRPALDSTSRMLLARDGVDTLDPLLLLLLLLLLPTSRLPNPTNMVALSMRSLKLI